MACSISYAGDIYIEGAEGEVGVAGMPWDERLEDGGGIVILPGAFSIRVSAIRRETITSVDWSSTLAPFEFPLWMRHCWMKHSLCGNIPKLFFHCGGHCGRRKEALN